MLSLGRWQLHRADERRALTSAIEAAREMVPLALTSATPESELTAWRNTRVQGFWLPEHSVMIENRNYEGQPGYWVATPMRLDDGAQPPRSVLVLRGWLPRALSGPPPLPPPVIASEQAVEGELAMHVPRLFELGGGQYSQLPDHLQTASGAMPPVVQNLALSDYARASGLSLMPVVLMQTRPTNDDLVHDWPKPSLDYNQNQGYAFQWFAFASIAGVAWLVVAWRALRRRLNRRQSQS